MQVSDKQWGRRTVALVSATATSWLFLHFSIPAWNRLLPELPAITGIGQLVLFWCGGCAFGVIAARCARSDRLLQLVVAGGIVFWWLVVPYGFIEGTFFPLIPAFVAVTAVCGVWVGQRIISRRQ